MGKKGKKKTIASTKKIVKTPEQIEQERREKKFLNKLFKGRKKKPEPIAEMKKAEAPKYEAPQQEEVKNEVVKHEAPKKDQGPVSRGVSPNGGKKPRKPLFTDAQRQKMKGSILVLIGLFMVGFVSYFLYQRLFRPQPLAHFLPADSTIGYLEVNIDGNSDQVKKFENLFQKYPVYHPANLEKLVNLVFPVNYENDLAPWIGRQIGIVLMKQTSDDNSVKLLFFIENKDAEKTLAFLKGRVLANSGDELLTDDYKGYTLYHYKLSQNYYFSFINNYLVLSGNDILLKQLVDEQGTSGNKLQDDPIFQKVDNNLPQTGLVFGYGNMQKLFDTMSENPLFQGKKMSDLIALQPFMKIFSAEGFTLLANDNDLTVQQFEEIDRTQLQGQTYLTYSDKYQGNLLELASENSILMAGGHDVYKEIQRLGQIFSTGTNIDAMIFNGILEAQKDKYFGKDISLDADIYPLLKNEYLVTVENNFDQPVVSMFMQLGDKNNDVVRIEKLATAFMQQRAIFTPKVQDVTLADGTKGQEIVASAEDITRSDNSYNGYNVTTLQLGSLTWSINYAVLDNTLVISTDLQALKNIIDRKGGKIQTNLRNSADFNKIILPVMRTADEIFSIKLGALVPFFGLDQNANVKPYVEPFNSLTTAKNFFDDGISTIYVINVL